MIKIKIKFIFATAVALTTLLMLCDKAARAGANKNSMRKGMTHVERQPIDQIVDNKKGILNTDNLKKDINQSTVKIRSSVDGSGVIVKKDKGVYEILTAWHVLKNTSKNEKIKIDTFDGMQHKGVYKSISRMGASDMATIKFISDRNYNPAKILETTFKREMEIIVAGYPNGSDTIYFDDGRITFSFAEAIKDGIPNIFMDQGYQLIYTSKTMFGISGAGIFNIHGKLIAIHGRGELDRQVTKREKTIVKSGVNYGMPVNIYLDPVINASSSRLSKVMPSKEDFGGLEVVNTIPIHRGNERMIIALSDEFISKEKYFPAYLFKARALSQIGDHLGSIQVLSEGLSISNLTTREKIVGLTHRASNHSVLANHKEVINDNKKIIKLSSDPSQDSYNDQIIGDNIVSSKLAIISALKSLRRTKEAQANLKSLKEYKANNDLNPWSKYQIDNALAHEKLREGKHEESLELFYRALSHIESENLPIKSMIDLEERELLKDKEYTRHTLDHDIFKEARKDTMLFVAGFIYPVIGQVRNSIDIVNKYIKNDPFDLKALTTRASILQRNGEYTKAEADALKVLDIEPRQSDALLTLSRIYEFRDNDMQKSCQYYAKSVLERGGATFFSNTSRHKDCKRLGFVD